MDNREIINETLVHLFHEIQKLEEEAIITEDFKDLTNNDMHIIEAVGLEGGNMSSIAAKLDITVGSLTTSMNSLVKKGYTERERSEKDRRIVYIHLTGKGRQAFHHHAKFHEQMTDAVMAALPASAENFLEANHSSSGRLGLPSAMKKSLIMSMASE